MTLPTNLNDLIQLVRAAEARCDKAEKERDEWRQRCALAERELQKLRGRLAAVKAMGGEE